MRYGLRPLPVLLAALLAGALPACAPLEEDPGRPTPITAPRVDIPDVSEDRHGAVYEQDRGLDLFTDRSARRAGDLVTVLVEEEMSGERSVNSEMAREQEGDIPAPQLGGQEMEVGGQPFAFEQDGEVAFEGGGSADQDTNLNATITAVVVDTTPNGHLIIQGEKAVTVSQGQERLRISGVVRADDVGANNEVSSDRIANLQVGYTGSETLSESAQPGWLTDFLMRRH